MRQAGPVMIAFVKHEHLRLVLQAAERGRMDHPVAVAAKRAAGPARRLRHLPAPAEIGVACENSPRRGHSNGHRLPYICSSKGLIPFCNAHSYTPATLQ